MMVLTDCKYEKHVHAELVSTQPDSFISVTPIDVPVETKGIVEIWTSAYSTTCYLSKISNEITSQQVIPAIGRATMIFGILSVIFAIIALCSFIFISVGVGIASLGPLLASLVGLFGFRNWKGQNPNSE